MILRLMNSHNAMRPFIGNWVDIAPVMKGKNEKAVSLQISWKELTGHLSGFITLTGSNDKSNAGYKKIYQIDVNDNYYYSELIVVRQVFKFLKIDYIPMGILSGQIDAHLYYK